MIIYTYLRCFAELLPWTRKPNLMEFLISSQTCYSSVMDKHRVGLSVASYQGTYLCVEARNVSHSEWWRVKGDERLGRDRGGGIGWWRDTRHLSSLQLSDISDRTRIILLKHPWQPCCLGESDHQLTCGPLHSTDGVVEEGGEGSLVISKLIFQPNLLYFLCQNILILSKILFWRKWGGKLT